MSEVTPKMMEWVKSISQKNLPGLNEYTLGVVKQLMLMGFKVRIRGEK